MDPIAGIGIAGLLFAAWAYRQSGRELRAEAARLRQLTTVLACGLEDAGVLKLTRDAAGEIVGLALEAGVQETTKLRATQDATYTPGK
jgi:hypothetical protein